MKEILRTLSLTMGILLPTQFVHAQGGPVIGWTDRGDAIKSCLKVQSKVAFAPGDTNAYPVLLKGDGIYVIGSARLDETRGVVTVVVDKARHPDGRDFAGHFGKLAYPIDVVNSGGCATRVEDSDPKLRHADPSQRAPGQQ